MKIEVTSKCEKRREKREEGRQKIEENVEASKSATAAPAKMKMSTQTLGVRIWDQIESK